MRYPSLNNMNTIPNKLTITNGAMAMDGGSIDLIGTNPDLKEVNLHLDWSLASQKSKTAQIYINGTVVPKRSLEETAWLDLIYKAEVKYSDPDGSDQDEVISKQRLVLAKDAGDYFDAIDEGPFEALKALKNNLVEIVKSEAYQNGGYEFANP